MLVPGNLPGASIAGSGYLTFQILHWVGGGLRIPHFEVGGRLLLPTYHTREFL